MQPLNTLAKEEQRKIQVKGGKARAEQRRQRKSMREQANILLSLSFNVRDKNGKGLVENLKALGVPEDQIDNQMASMVALWQTSLHKGTNQVSAFEKLQELVGEKDKTQIESVNRITIVNDLPKED